MQMMNAVSTTSPTYKYGTSTSIPGNIVVKQVDLMSPLLFNSVIDLVTSELKDAISINDNSHIIKYMAFADDLVTFGKVERVFKINLLYNYK